MSLRYRPEIDGLRALAVLPVILFHAGFVIFPGGFVGVDVFFVISGYLITSIILSDIERDRFSLLNFYERRVRRILPALFFVMVVSIPFAWLWLMPADMKNFGQSVAAVTVFSSNFLFWKETGYFSPNSELKPLLHTWSLAVEEQYYLIFPIFMILAWRLGKKAIIPILLILSVGSLLFAQARVESAQAMTFFLLPTRGWEILLGALLALGIHKNRFKEFPRHVDQVLSILGLLMIFFSIFFFSQLTPFPSLYTLVPTIGAMLVILSAREKTFAHRLLSNRVMVGIGLISYSAYLWHQPVFAFVRHRSFSEPSLLLMGFLSLLTIALAFLTWRYVERPFRNRANLRRSQVFALSALVGVAFISFGVYQHKTNGLGLRPHMENVAIDVKNVHSVHCFNDGRRTAEQLRNDDFCTGGSGNIRLAVIGDSHAGAIFDVMSVKLEHEDVGFWAVAGGYCAPVYHFSLILYGDDCENETKAALDKIRHNQQIETVILVANWGIYTNGHLDRLPASRVKFGDLESSSITENPSIFKIALMKTIRDLNEAGKKIYIVEPVPEFHNLTVNTVQKSKLFGTGNEYPTIELSEYHERNREVFEIFKDIEDASFIVMRPLFCGDTICESVSADGELLFNDTNHVTDYGARLVVDAILEKIRES
jgi:peptidoglycan/LPS O-acetylase OafA/YrhL